MNKEFINALFIRQQRAQAIPRNESIAQWAFEIIGLLFPESSDRVFNTAEEIEKELEIILNNK